MQRVADWSARITHEAQMWEENSFVTLTYGTGNLPPNGSLTHRDYQLFQKRLSKRLKKPIRFFMCGEYGDETGRPHYHACLFNEGFNQDKKYHAKSPSGEAMYTSELLTEIWGHGHCTVQDLTPKSAAYCAGYIMKKTLGPDAADAYNIITETGETIKRVPPYSKCSLKPGIGKKWLEKHGDTDALNQDYIIIDGAKRSLPKYYSKELKKRNGGELPEHIHIKRDLQAQRARPENTTERLAVREEVHKAKLRNWKRSL